MMMKPTEKKHTENRRSSTGAAPRMRVIPGEGQGPGEGPEQESGPGWSLAFAEMGRRLGEAIQGRGLVVPNFRSPPREVGRRRSLVRHGDGSATVSVLVRNRPWVAVMSDMIEGVVVANRLDGIQAEALRDQLWAALAGESPSQDAAA
ncbi:hypothetical protein [Candidatus Poriferisocius sp.]|uniref:hypothetical protein n=1 Tax=Candidatus Poriferisocius sp. TaxID=3101276 RepID=UPI003B01950C